MRRPLILATLAIVAHASPARSEPLTISGAKSAVWNNPTGGPSTGAGTAWLHFGQYDASSLGWSGNNTFSTASGSPFSLGIAWLTNGSSLNPPTHATFSVTLGINSPKSEVPATFNFDAQLLSSNRNGGGSLTLAVTPGQTAKWTSANGATYSLEMLGLSSNWQWDGKTTSQITAADCNSQTYAWIYAKLSLDDPTIAHVPEPGALVLVGIGLGLVALRRRWMMAV